MVAAGLLLAVIAAAVLIGSGAGSAIASALVTIAVVLGAVTGLAVLGGIALLVYRARSGPARSDRAGLPIRARPVYQLPPDPRPELEETPNRRSGRSARSTTTSTSAPPRALAAILRHSIEEK